MQRLMSAPIRVNNAKYYRTVAAVLIPGILLAITMIIQGTTSWKTNPVEWGLLILLITYYVTSLEKVETGLRGGLTVLEDPALETGSGWFFVPRWLCEIDRMPAHSNQDQFPADPEMVSKRDDDQGLLPGEYRPIRAMTAGSNDQDGDDPLNTRLTLEVTFAVRWRLREGRFFDLYVKIPGRRWADKVASVRQQMRDTGETEVLEEIADRTPSRIISEMELVNANLKTELQKAVEDWGIDIDEARMQAPDFPHTVNVALARIAESRATRQATETDAHGEKTRLTLIGEGQAAAMMAVADARKRELAAEGEGLRLAADALDMTGEDYRAGEIAKATIGEGTLVLGSEGIAQAMGLGKLIVGGAKGEKQ